MNRHKVGAATRCDDARPDPRRLGAAQRRFSKSAPGWHPRQRQSPPTYERIGLAAHCTVAPAFGAGTVAGAGSRPADPVTWAS
jgi:hypothetical protein